MLPFLAFLAPAAKNVGWLLLKALVYAFVVLTIGFSLWRLANPKPTTTQTGGTSYTIKVGFGGCIRLPTNK